MILYLYTHCSTCQKAVRFLEEKKVVFSRKEIVVTPPSIDELRKMLNYMGGNIKKIFNTSGHLYREMQLNEKLKTLPQEEALLLLSQQGMLVKRPFLLGPDFGLVGFKENEWTQKFCHAP